MDKASSAVSGALPRAVKVVRISDGKVDVAALLGLNVGTEADIENRKTHHDDELDHDHDDFESFVVPLPETSDPQALSDLVSATAEAAGVLRIKGFAAVSNKPMRLLVQAVGPRVTTQYDRAWMPTEKRQTQLVVIGLKGLDRDKIVRMLNG
jgi:cobalamin biosynthesis protein CobW